MSGPSTDTSSKQLEKDLLARGDIFLQQLAEEAAAARAEAKRIELQRLMAEARQGNVSPLEEWLEENQDNSHRSSESEPAEAKNSGAKSGVTEPSLFSSWDRFKASAKERLVERAKPSRSQQSSSARIPAKVAVELVEDSPEAKARFQALAKQLAVPDSEEEAERKAAQKRGALLSRLGGAGVSAVAHILLIVVLAFITLQVPASNAGMSFEASATAAEEPVELTQPLDVQTPDVAEPTTETEVSADFDFSDTIQAAAPSEALGNMGAVGNALSPAAAAMSSAVQSSAVPNMTGSKFFGAAAGGNNFCYVIDGSGSMRGGPWEAAKFELFKSLDSLKPKQRFYIIFFGRDFEAISMPGERDPAPASLYGDSGKRAACSAMGQRLGLRPRWAAD